MPEPVVLDFDAAEHGDFLRDESRLVGAADTLSFPTDGREVAAILRRMNADGVAVTIQGARTGITGGSVPMGGHVMNLSRMNRIRGLRRDDDFYYVRVEPGVLLEDLNQALHTRHRDAGGWADGSGGALADLRSGREHFLPPDPTEKSASIGGMIACNASGSRTYGYGPTMDYVSSLDIVFAGGGCATLRRGIDRAVGRQADIRGRGIELPTYDVPRIKNAAGYYVRPNMDLVCLFVGAEGTLGVVTEAELRLEPLPTHVWGITCFLPSEPQALEFVQALQGRGMGADWRRVAIEFFDVKALDLLRRQKTSNPAFDHLPILPREFHTAVYVEYHGEDEEGLEEELMGLVSVLKSCGGSEEETWTGMGPQELQRLMDFRHAVPESVNLLIDERRRSDPTITKLGTDMAVPQGCLQEVVALYHEGLDRLGLEYAIFGHIGNNHVHVNILPSDAREYRAGKALYLEWARAVVAMGGTVSAEHGIGKLKVEFLELMYGSDGVREMRTLKRSLDPQGTLNPGNLFGPGTGADHP